MFECQCVSVKSTSHNKHIHSNAGNSTAAQFSMNVFSWPRDSHFDRRDTCWPVIRIANVFSLEVLTSKWKLCKIRPSFSTVYKEFFSRHCWWLKCEGQWKDQFEAGRSTGDSYVNPAQWSDTWFLVFPDLKTAPLDAVIKTRRRVRRVPKIKEPEYFMIAVQGS